MSVAGLAKAVVGARPRPKAIHVGYRLFTTVYDHLKALEEPTGKWMRWSSGALGFPNILFMGLPMVIDPDVAPDSFSLKA